jgi:predicted MFS family arabinose efflux permease
MGLFKTPEERLITLVGSISFLSGMVFSMVGALAPMFSRDLGIPSQSIGTIMGSYMLASAVSGFLGTLYLDRFDRRKGLAVGLTGVVFGLVLTALAPNLPLLIAARVLSGVFAGPSSALSVAIIVDNIPAERRGRALGSVAAFGAMAQIIGIPAGLGIARLFDSWRSPFFAIAIAGALLAVFVIRNLPSQRAHLLGGASFAVRQRLRLLGQLLSRPICLITYALQMTGIVPLVAITTIMSVFLVNNLGYPQDGLLMLYFVGGGANVLIARQVGKAIDRFGSGIVALGSTLMLSLAIAVGYLGFFYPALAGLEGAMRLALSGPFWDGLREYGIYLELLPIIAVFALFFVTSSGRLVVGQTIAMRIPRPEERAGFQALGQSIQSLTMAMSALAIPKLLGSTATGQLTGVARFSWIVLAVTWIFPFLVYWLDSLLNRKEAAGRREAAEALAAGAVTAE